MSHSKIIICIPARYGSTRFPGKALADLKGKPVVQWTYEKACLSIADEVIIATDNDEIYNTAQSFGAKCAMTSEDHPSGSDRIWEAVQNIPCDIIINVQGDEPLIDVDIINKLIDLLRSNEKVEMGTVVVKTGRDIIGQDTNVVKAVLSKDNSVLYFSRSEIPFVRDEDDNSPLYKHLGIYGYRKHILKKIISLPQSYLEKTEKLEQLRALENNIKIYAIVADKDSGIGIDTPEDLKKAEKLITV
ncbi:MAG TPA: 3-deoxy-manno-octulosonate cytidylyltransferase [Victivallales bacterium]|nr:3-deoxy-manno-octulosonate cytidylyltransferase [Victivallales bacterium]